jgi:hypothetical protein
MTMRGVAAAITVLSLAAFASAAMAEQPSTWIQVHWIEVHWAQVDSWRATHEAIYALENRNALLEADPQVDDGYRAPIISRARADIRRLRATLPREHWQWVVPCCYSRKHIVIR